MYLYLLLSLSVILLDNLKGRQLLHTTYKMFMTAAGVEGENRRSVTHAALLLADLPFMIFFILLFRLSLYLFTTYDHCNTCT